jgi:hypothetical protein
VGAPELEQERMRRRDRERERECVCVRMRVCVFANENAIRHGSSHLRTGFLLIRFRESHTAVTKSAGYGFSSKSNGCPRTMLLCAKAETPSRKKKQSARRREGERERES